jgi:hypothetical protein
MPSQLCTRTAKTRAMAPEAPTLSNYTAGPLAFIKNLSAIKERRICMIFVDPFLEIARITI